MKAQQMVFYAYGQSTQRQLASQRVSGRNVLFRRIRKKTKKEKKNRLRQCVQIKLVLLERNHNSKVQ